MSGVYERLKWSEGSDGSLAVPCESLGLELRFEDDRLRRWDPEAHEYLLDHQEEHAGRLEERDKRIASEQQVRDLKTKLASLK